MGENGGGDWGWMDEMNGICREWWLLKVLFLFLFIFYFFGVKVGRVPIRHDLSYVFASNYHPISLLVSCFSSPFSIFLLPNLIHLQSFIHSVFENCYQSRFNKFIWIYIMEHMRLIPYYFVLISI